MTENSEIAYKRYGGPQDLPVLLPLLSIRNAFWNNNIMHHVSLWKCSIFLHSRVCIRMHIQVLAGADMARKTQM